MPPDMTSQNGETTIKEFKGKVFAIDTAARVITLKDEQGASHPFKWCDVLDVVMKKWKTGYFLALKYDNETRVLKSAAYWQEGKDTWPKGQPGTGRSYQPRNERMIVVQSLVKAYGDLYASTIPAGVTVTFDEACEAVLKAVERDIDRVMKTGGA